MRGKVLPVPTCLAAPWTGRQVRRDFPTLCETYVAHPLCLLWQPDRPREQARRTNQKTEYKRYVSTMRRGADITVQRINVAGRRGKIAGYLFRGTTPSCPHDVSQNGQLISTVLQYRGYPQQFHCLERRRHPASVPAKWRKIYLPGHASFLAPTLWK